VSILYIGHLGPLIYFPPFLLTKVAKVAKVELQIEAAVPLVVLSPDSFEDMHL
jgi:hypothetical protein